MQDLLTFLRDVYCLNSHKNPYRACYLNNLQTSNQILTGSPQNLSWSYTRWNFPVQTLWFPTLLFLINFLLSQTRRVFSHGTPQLGYFGDELKSLFYLIYCMNAGWLKYLYLLCLSLNRWSYGVVLFEILTLGGTPYPTISNHDLLRELQRGYRMEKPDNCSPPLWV